MATVWVGTKTMQEEPGSPSMVTTAGGRTQSRRWRGLYTDLETNQPLPGDNVSGSPGDLVVDRVVVTKDKATSGRMEVFLISLVEGFGAVPKAAPPTYEIDSGQIEKPITGHPIYAPGGSQALTDADRDAIEEWRAATEASARTTQYTALSANAKHLADKIRRGVESYLMPAPIARKTTMSWKPANPAALGKRGAPSGFGAALPSGYEWIKTTDRAVRTGNVGRWERVEEWLAADKWDPDLYPSA